MIRRKWLLAGCLFGLAGCLHGGQTVRPQSAEVDERDIVAEVRTIGDFTGVANAEPIAVYGVGLVEGLHGTGGGNPPGRERAEIEEYLRKRGISNTKAVLDSREYAVVHVAARVPAGARKGDNVDLEINLPPGSKVQSLKGGRLIECQLYNYDTTTRVNPQFNGLDRALKGHALVKAHGAVLVGNDDPETAKPDQIASGKVGRVWGGGKCQIDRPFYLVLNPETQRVPVAMRIAERINETFAGPRGGGAKLADPKDKERVLLQVPDAYRHNLPRYLRVVRLIPLETPTMGEVGYRQRLEKMLLDPATCIVAALRLEALGSDVTNALKTAITHPTPLVRFAAAESLAYLGQPACGEPLAKLIKEEPLVQSYCLTALGSLDEAVCHVKLQELMSDADPTVRYGAFRALHALDTSDPALGGESVHETFHLHQVAPSSAGMIHLVSGRRAEVVLFGQTPTFQPPFSFLAGGDYTITAGAGDTKVTLSRFSKGGAPERRQCGLAIAEVVRNLAELGANYPDVVEVLQQAHEISCLSCPLVVDAYPKTTSIDELVKLATVNGHLRSTAAHDLRDVSGLGSAPTLFNQPGAEVEPVAMPDGTAALIEEPLPAKTEKPTADARNTKRAPNGRPIRE
jgi:hypothetical protein